MLLVVFIIFKHFILHRGQQVYEIDSIFGSEIEKPTHFFMVFQDEEIFTTKLNQPQTNPYR